MMKKVENGRSSEKNGANQNGGAMVLRVRKRRDGPGGNDKVVFDRTRIRRGRGQRCARPSLQSASNCRDADLQRKRCWAI